MLKSEMVNLIKTFLNNKLEADCSYSESERLLNFIVGEGMLPPCRQERPCEDGCGSNDWDSDES